MSDVIAALRALSIPGWGPREREVSYVGHGESFDAWKLSDPDGGLPPVLARVARRVDMPKPMGAEIAALETLAGTGLAPRLYTHDADSRNALGAPFVVISFENGVVKDPEEWSFEEVRAVIDRAARLHAATARPGSTSGMGWFQGSVEYWRGAAPEAIAVGPVARLICAVEAFVQEREGAFERMTDLALVHGDLVASNVLLDAGEPRFVDWEWAEVHDVARDIALIGGQSYGGEWYVPLTDGQVTALIERYAGVRGLNRQQRNDLAVRRDAWMAMDRLFSSIHFSLTGIRAHAEAARTMQSTLAEFLSVSVSPPSS